MAGYAHKVNRVTLFGSMYNGAEIWSTSFYAGAAGADSLVPNESMAQTVKDAWETFFELLANQFSYVWKTEGVKIAQLNAGTGKTEGVPVTSYYATPIAGSANTIGFPPQVALVATLLADNGKGLGGKGRMYLPGIASPLADTGKTGGVFNQTLATNLANFYETIGSSFDSPGALINASQGRGADLGAGKVNRVVTHIRVGDVYDTQRRRRNALNEVYATSEIGGA